MPGDLLHVDLRLGLSPVVKPAKTASWRARLRHPQGERMRGEVAAHECLSTTIPTLIY